MLPEGWKYSNLGEFASNITSGSRDWAQYYSDTGDKFVRMTNLARDGVKISENDMKFVSIPHDSTDGKRTALKNGDILISITAELGKIGLVPNGFGTAFINQHLALVRLKTATASSTFVAYALSSKKLNQKLNSLNDAGAKAGLNLSTIRSIPILLPPLPEQKKIAAILSTWDRAIEGTEKLLANSQQQKKALMQQLLTGKKRLPGFMGEWVCHKLGEIAGFLKGKGLSKADINPKGKTPCIHYGSLFTEQPSTITETKTLTNTFKGAVFSKKNDVLMPTSDVTPAGLAVASAIQKDNVLLGNDILIIRPNSERLYGPFLSRIIRNSKKKILSFATGTTVFHLYASDMKGFQLLVPPVPEQKAIAAVLSTADEEITALESDLSRLRQEKKALMQQLLTGKIRVAV